MSYRDSKVRNCPICGKNIKKCECSVADDNK